MKLNASKCTPEKMQEDSEQSAAQEAVHSLTLSAPEFLTLWDRVQQLEEWLRESGSRLPLAMVSAGANEDAQNMSQSELSTFGNIINDLKENYRCLIWTK